MNNVKKKTGKGGSERGTLMFFPPVPPCNEKTWTQDVTLSQVQDEGLWGMAEEHGREVKGY